MGSSDVDTKDWHRMLKYIGQGITNSTPSQWSDIGDAIRIFGDLVRETPDEVRAFFLT